LSARRARDRLLDAVEDLEVAKILAREGRFARAYFHAHQGAEKALKALLIREAGRYEPIYGVREPLEMYRVFLEAPDGLLRAASKLDSHYIPPRYPNAWPSGPSWAGSRRS